MDNENERKIEPEQAREREEERASERKREQAREIINDDEKERESERARERPKVNGLCKRHRRTYRETEYGLAAALPAASPLPAKRLATPELPPAGLDEAVAGGGVLSGPAGGAALLKQIHKRRDREETQRKGLVSGRGSKKYTTAKNVTRSTIRRREGETGNERKTASARKRPLASVWFSHRFSPVLFSSL